MASKVVSDAPVYLIQLEDIAEIDTKPAAGDLWQLESGEIMSSDSRSSDAGFTLKCCILNLPEDAWISVLFTNNYRQYFSEVDHAHFHLLLAVTKLRIRLDLFLKKQRLLKWAATLCPGCRVCVRVKNDKSLYESLTGIVRHAGRLLSDSVGWHFGIELDPEFEGKGTSSGEFKKHKYFECKEDCAVFVSIDKLEELHSSHSSGTDSSYVSNHPTSSSSETLLTEKSVADMVQNCVLAINDRVVWMSDNGPEYGTVRWIGVLPDAPPPTDESQLTVGVEFDNPVGSGTGRYHSQTLFTARRRHASLIPIIGLLKESDLHGFVSGMQLPSVVCADSEPSDLHQRTSDNLWTSCTTNESSLPDVVKQNPASKLLQSEYQNGVPVIHVDPTSVLSSVDRKGCVLPPSIADAGVLCGVNRGIQHYSDSCALESIIFVIFAFYSYFDKHLFATPTGNLDGAVKNILVEQIVNPLRATYFVSCDKMRRFGELFTMIQSANLAGCATSNLTLSDDPSGTITTMLHELLRVDPLIALTNSSCYVYDVDVCQTYYPFPSLQHVIESAVVNNPNRRLLQHPQSVFIVNVDSVRFRKQVTCGRIFPGLILDISGILHSTIRSCRACGRQGSLVCGSCFTDANMLEMTDAYRLLDYVFCEECFDRNHRPANREDHQPFPLAAATHKSPQTLQEQSLLELIAVVSFINGHYVSFVKVGVGDALAWLMYDGKAAVGCTSSDKSRIVLPEIKRCQEIEAWLKDIPASQKADSLPDVIVKLTSGLRLCFYQPRHM